MSIAVLGTDRSWISLHYNAEQAPPGWYWPTESGYYPVRNIFSMQNFFQIAGTQMEQYWYQASPNPNLSNGECVNLRNCGVLEKSRSLKDSR
jgi:hypothetical protein